MSGLIFGALGQSLANIGNTVGNYVMQDIRDEDRQEERRRELEERRAYERERDALYRRTADQQAAGRPGSGSGPDGIPMRDLGEGGAGEGLLARRAGMTVPELRALRRFSETGDMSPFGTKVKTLDDEYGAMESTAYPPGLDRELKAKAQVLSKIEESFVLGSKYDDVTKGRRNQQEVDASDAAIRDPSKAGIIGQGMAAGDSKPLVDVKDGTAFNQYTGANQATEKGRSEITENLAQAGKATAEGRKALAEAAEGGKVSQERLTTMVNSANATIKTLTEGGRGRTPEEKAEWQRQYDAAVQLRDRATTLLNQGLGARAPAPAPAPGKDSKPGEAPTAAPKNNGPFQVGAERVVAAGPHKGKTAVWDGQGWKLKQ
jgi:hypothetical protein